MSITLSEVKKLMILEFDFPTSFINHQIGMSACCEFYNHMIEGWSAEKILSKWNDIVSKNPCNITTIKSGILKRCVKDPNKFKYRLTFTMRS